MKESSYVKVIANRVIAACEEEIKRLVGIRETKQKEIREKREAWIQKQLAKKKLFSCKPKWTRETLEEWLKQEHSRYWNTNENVLDLNPESYNWYKNDVKELESFISLAKCSTDGFVLLSTHDAHRLNI